MSMKRSILSYCIVAGITFGIGAIGCGQPDRHTDSEKEQCIKTIKELKGTVEIDENLPGKPVVRVRLMAAEGDVTKALPCLQTLTELRELNIGITNLDDAGLASLSSLNNLRRLDLTACNITDSGLKKLQ